MASFMSGMAGNVTAFNTVTVHTRVDGQLVEQDARKIWRLLARNWHLFRGTPSRMWLTHALSEVFGIDEKLGPESADRVYDRIADCLAHRPTSSYPPPPSR